MQIILKQILGKKQSGAPENVEEKSTIVRDVIKSLTALWQMMTRDTRTRRENWHSRITHNDNCEKAQREVLGADCCDDAC